MTHNNLIFLFSGRSYGSIHFIYSATSSAPSGNVVILSICFSFGSECCQLWHYFMFPAHLFRYNDISKHALASMPELESPTKKSEKLLDNQLQSSNRPPGFGG